MDFGLDKSQKEIQKAAMEFAKGEFESELSLEMEGKNEFPQKIRFLSVSVHAAFLAITGPVPLWHTDDLWKEPGSVQ